MPNGRGFLRHEILNIITLLNFLIIDTELPPEKKREILEHLKMIGLLSSQDEFILVKRKRFFNQTIDLQEVFEIISPLVSMVAEEKEIELTFPEGTMMVQADGNVVKNGLENLLYALMEHSSKITCELVEKKKMLLIHYESDHVFSLNNASLLEYLNEKHTYPEIFCKLHVELMKANEIQLQFKKNRVEIYFPA